MDSAGISMRVITSYFLEEDTIKANDRFQELYWPTPWVVRGAQEKIYY